MGNQSLSLNWSRVKLDYLFVATKLGHFAVTLRDEGYFVLSGKGRKKIAQSLLGGQSYKDFYTLGQIYKPVIQHENMR